MDERLENRGAGQLEGETDVTPQISVQTAGTGTQEELLKQIVELQKQVLEKETKRQESKNGGRVFFVVVMMLVGLTYTSIFFFGGLLGMTDMRMSGAGLGYIHNMAFAPIAAVLAFWAAAYLILKKHEARLLANVALGVVLVYELSANIDGYMQMMSYIGGSSRDVAMVMALGRFVLGAVVVGALLLVLNKTKALGEKMILDGRRG